MNKEERIEQCMEVERYLQNKNIYQIMQGLVEELLISQPSDPLTHMINHLSKPTSCLTLLIGPPGLHLYKIASQALSEESNSQYAAFNSGQFIESSKGSLSQQAQTMFNECRLISHNLMGDKLVDQVVNFAKKNNYALIEGFPKTLQQGISLHKKGIIPDKVIFINTSKQSLHELCYQKIKTSNPNLSSKQIQKKVSDSLNQYQMNVKDLKNYYPSYLEIDASNQKLVSGQIKKSLNLHLGKIKPRQNTRIVILGAPFSGRTTLGKKIAAKYNLIYVSSAVLISQEIRRDTVVGRKINQKYIANQMIDNFTVEKLIEERISKIDCQMQGYVLEGYPKSLDQYQNLKNLHIYPDFIIGMQSSASQIKNRAGKQISPESLGKRMAKWKQFSASLSDIKDIFWVQKSLSIENTFESVCFEIENHKN